jgi:hypothetical protein
MVAVMTIRWIYPGLPQVGEPADHGVGRQVHDRGKTISPMIAVRFAPLRPAVSMARPSRHASLIYKRRQTRQVR